MLSRAQRTAILELHACEIGTRAIARALKVSRGSVKQVIASGSEEKHLERSEKSAAYHEEIAELHAMMKGNLVRVHEELASQGIELSYPALTAYCRRHGIGTKAPKPVGRYHFEPGAELQHDTSPHRVEIGGKVIRVQTASAVLAYSRMLYFSCYPCFTRFECKVFLTEALRTFDGVPGVVMIDNTHVVVAHGTGACMVPAPEMAAFADRFGFSFRAHEKGDANRSGRVERPFSYIEGNFLAGRRFADWHDLAVQAREWCDKVNATVKRHLKAAPRELFLVERPALRRLPLWVPEVVQVHHRLVDHEGFVCLHTNRYSVPLEWLTRRVEVRERFTTLEIDIGREVVKHQRLIGVRDQRVTLPEHRPRRGAPRPQMEPEEDRIRKLAPELGSFVAALKHKTAPGRALRKLLRMLEEYPRAPLLAAVTEAQAYGLYALDRIERMVLERIAKEYFHLEGPHE